MIVCFLKYFLGDYFFPNYEVCLTIFPSGDYFFTYYEVCLIIFSGDYFLAY
jgi:hypothetical protein